MTSFWVFRYFLQLPELRRVCVCVCCCVTAQLSVDEFSAVFNGRHKQFDWWTLVVSEQHGRYGHLHRCVYVCPGDRKLC